MTKIFTVFFLSLLLSSTAFSAKKEVSLRYSRNKNPNKNTGIAHRPMTLPIDVYTDSDTHTIEVCCDDPIIEGEVYLYDSTGNVENYSPVINTVFPVYAPGEYTISIQGDIWSGEAQIFID